MTVPKLADMAAGALPRHLRRVYRESNGDAELVAEEAEAYVPLRLAGRVGTARADLAARLTATEGVLRVDCANNPEFWLEINVNTLEVRGRVPDRLHDWHPSNAGHGAVDATAWIEGLDAATERFTPQHRQPLRGFVARRLTADTIRVDHTGAQPFWLEIAS